ncbi:MAG: hypothetical protein IPK78_19570 [Rhodospirillales bacterium]|nr:hypothetical protein [Rhodospirillales bacterium]
MISDKEKLALRDAIHGLEDDLNQVVSILRQSMEVGLGGTRANDEIIRGLDVAMEHARSQFDRAIQSFYKIRSKNTNEMMSPSVIHNYHEKVHVGDRYKAEQGVMGPSAHADNGYSNRAGAGFTESRLGELAAELAILRERMKAVAGDPEHDISIER